MEQIKKIWKSADCVCFDVDSTVVTDEGIDQIAAFLGRGDEVAKLTATAMEGDTSYKMSLKARLDIIHPSRQQIERFIKSHPPRFTANVRLLVTKLQQKQVPIYLISGGFRCLVEPVAVILGIPLENVFANRLLFFYNGDFAGFDESQPTCEGNGKSIVIQQLKSTHGYKRLVHIGDGVTDLDACPPADAFIGFGGNQVRERVRNESQWFVTDFSELATAL